MDLTAADLETFAIEQEIFFPHREGVCGARQGFRFRGVRGKTSHQRGGKGQSEEETGAHERGFD
jgi:hypothetical protein